MSLLSQTDDMSRRMIQLTITDCRESIWKDTPHGQRVQKDWLVTDVPISNGSELFETLMTTISSKLKENKLSTNFELANPDCVRLKPSNVGEYGKNLACLVLLDKNQTQFPFVYKLQYSTVPHTRAVTNQTGKFYGEEGNNPAAFAIAELVDNSLAATVKNEGDRIIEIHIHEDGENSSLAVLDNGEGMNAETLKSSLKYKAPKDSRITENSEPVGAADENESVHPIYINSNISKFGAGLKQAAFFLGEEARIMTKRVENDNVYEVRYSRELMETKELLNNEDPWAVQQYTGKVGLQRDNKASSVVNSLLQKERGKPSFTHIVVEKIRRGDQNSPLGLLLKRDANGGSSIEKQLAHVYYYYLHGRDGIKLGTGGDTEKLVKIVVTRFHRQEVISRLDLAAIRDDLTYGNMLDLESRFFLTATPPPFLFTIEVGQFNETNARGNFRIGGIIRYHPFLYDHETNPGAIVTRRCDIGSVVAESGESESADNEVLRKSGDFFHIWWNGRLIPHTRLESADWCSPGARMKESDKLYKSYGRISGSLFFDSSITDITDNKLNITTTEKLVEMLNGKYGIGTQQSIFHRVLPTPGNRNTLKARRMDAKKNFAEWLKGCQKHDMQVEYSNLILSGDSPESSPQQGELQTIKVGSKSYYRYGSAKWDKTKLKAGDAVKLINPDVVGRITCFYVDKENCIPQDGGSGPSEKLFAPLSEFELELQPTAYYEDGEGASLRLKEMRLIDKSVVPERAEELIRNRLDGLRFKLKMVGDMVPMRENGGTVPMDQVLFKSIVFDIVDGNGATVNGHLPHSETKASRKQIMMVARVYRVDESGQRELHYTSAIANYLSPAGDYPNGYYFKNLDLKQMDMQDVGNYVICFLSYIKVPVSGQAPSPSAIVARSRRSTSGRPPRPQRGPSAASSPRPPPVTDPSYEIEWKQEVDSLGRKIFTDGDTQVRLPYHEIQFTVVPGPPQKIEIEEFGEEDAVLRIGKPFSITLSLKDSKGIPTWPENWEMLTSQKPTISLLPNRKYPHLDLQFSCGESAVVDNRLVIKDVVAKGYLGGSDSKECKIEVGIQLNNTVKKCSPQGRISFHSGLPHKLVCSEESIKVENGSKAKIACHVADCSGNVIPHREDTKPHLLKCDIYKIGSSRDQFVCTRRLLATKVESGPEGMDEEICIEETKKLKCELVCKISYETCDPVSIMITLTPSTRPVQLRLYKTNKDNSKTVEVRNEDEILTKIGKRIRLQFKLFDGLDNEVEFDGNKQKLETSWSKMPVNNGQLPMIEVPTRTETRKEFITKFKILGQKGHILHKFYMTWYPLEACGLSVFFVGEHLDQLQLPIGMDPPDIVAKLRDPHGNMVTNIPEEHLLPGVQITAPNFNIGFEPVCANVEEIDASFMIKHLRITSDTNGNHLPLGVINLKVSFGQKFEAVLKVEIVPGPPCGLLFQIRDQMQPQRVTYSLPNKSNIPVRAYLIDAFGNETNALEPTPVKFTRGRHTEGGLSQDESDRSLTINEGGAGVADFGVISVAVEPSQNLVRNCGTNGCPGVCFGTQRFIQAETQVGGMRRTAICHLHISCRPEVPFKLVPVNGTGGFSYEAGSPLSNLIVTVESEDGSVFKQAQKEELRLSLVQIGDPLIQFELQPKAVNDGVYTFGEAPTKAGLYRMEYVYNKEGLSISNVGEQLGIFSAAINALMPEHILDNLSVSNDPENHENRIITPEFTLRLVDRFGNPVTRQGVRGLGKLFGIEDIPVENAALFATPFPLVGGQLTIPQLSIHAQTDFENNTKHMIQIVARMEDSSEFMYKLQFTFYNDVGQQNEIRHLESENSVLEQEISSKRERIQTVGKERETIRRELDRMEEYKRNLPNIRPEVLATLTTPHDIRDRERSLREIRDRLSDRWRENKSNIPPGAGAGEPDVLGPVGLLAEVKSEGRRDGGISEDLQLKRLLSWHLSSNLNVVVVEKEEKAHQLMTMFHNQRFMILDILRDFPTDWTQTPPPGPGNPVYARSLLQFTKTEVDLVKKVFDKLLGNVIIVDTLKDATAYMKLWNADRSRSNCPAILTRDCHRLSNAGIVGGNSNRAPELSRLQYKLGLAAGSELNRICGELEQLPKLRDILEQVGYKRGEENAKRMELEKMRVEMDQCGRRRDEILRKLEELKEQYQNQSQKTSPRKRPMTVRVARTPDYPVEEPFSKRPRRY